MKKYLFLASALLSLPALTSCGGPNGDPIHDAEMFEDLYERYWELDLREEEIDQQHMDYYAENEDKKAWLEYCEESDKLKKEIIEDKYQDKIEDLEEKIEDVEKEMKKDAKDDDE
ncbi:MAG: hypothetical protein IKW85_12175 [Muribaculaceae bacterium]|nr:hypothetical protein [Muribaculaceae bacterium]